MSMLVISAARSSAAAGGGQKRFGQGVELGDLHARGLKVGRVLAQHVIFEVVDDRALAKLPMDEADPNFLLPRVAATIEPAGPDLPELGAGLKAEVKPKHHGRQHQRQRRQSDDIGSR
jgi:hypothetical protein